MSKQYMIIQFGDRTATVRTNSEKAIKNALGKLRIHSNGTVVSFIIKGDIIEFEGTNRKAKWGFWVPTYTLRARIIENTFVTEETAEVVEAPVAEVVEAPAAEVITEEHTVTMSVEEKRAAWDIFVKEWAKSRANELKAIRAAEAKDVNA